MRLAESAGFVRVLGRRHHANAAGAVNAAGGHKSG